MIEQMSLPVVFISSTYIDLHKQRANIFLSLLANGVYPCGMEQFAAGAVPVEVISRAIANSCEVWCLVGSSFGHSWSSSEPEKSWVMKEVEIAQGMNKNVRFFVEAEKEFPQLPQLVDAQNRFRNKVKRETIVYPYSSAQHLQNVVLSAVNRIRRPSIHELVLRADNPVPSGGIEREHFYEELRAGAQHSYFCLGIGLSNVSQATHQHLRALENGMRLRFLLLNPKVFKTRALAESWHDFYDGQPIHKLLNVSLHMLLALANKARQMNLPGSIEVRCYDKFSTLNFTVIDEDTPTVKYTAEAVLRGNRRIRWMNVTRQHDIFEEALASAESLWTHGEQAGVYVGTTDLKIA